MARRVPVGQRSQTSVRVAKVIELYCNGANRQQITSYCVNEWGVHYTTVDRYVVEAKKEIQKRQDEKIEDVLSRSLSGIENQLFSAIENGEHNQTVLQIRQEMHKLQGAHEYIKAKHKDSGSTMTPEAYGKALAELLKGGEQ